MSEDVRVVTKEEEYLSLYESIRELYLEIFSNENELYNILTDFYGEANTECLLLDILNKKSKKPINKYPEIRKCFTTCLMNILDCMLNSQMNIPHTDTKVSIPEYINVVLDEPDIQLGIMNALTDLSSHEMIDKLYDAIEVFICEFDDFSDSKIKDKTDDLTSLTNKLPVFLFGMDESSYEDVANKVPEISTILKDVITIINCFRWLRIKTRDKTCIMKAGFEQSSAVNIMSYVSIYALKRILIKAINGSDMFTRMTFFIPEKTVTNAVDKSHTIYNIYTDLKFDEYLNYYGERMFRTKYTKDEVVAGYRFSHSPSFPTSADCGYFNENHIFGPAGLCFGEGPLKYTKISLATMSHKEAFIYYNLNDDFKNLFMLFCSQFNDYYEVESIDGGPYIFMRQIGQKISDTSHNIKINDLYANRDVNPQSMCTSVFQSNAFSASEEGRKFYDAYLGQTESEGNNFIMKCAIKYIASHFSYSFDGVQIILDNDVISIIKIVTDAFIYALEMAYKEYKGDDSVELPFNKFLRTSKYFISDGLIYTNEDGGFAALIDNVQSQIRLNAESGKQWILPWRDFKEEPIKCELIDFDIDNLQYVDALSIVTSSTMMQLVLNFINFNYKENGENQKFKEYEDGNHPVLRLS